jgi:hypothetical protein
MSDYIDIAPAAPTCRHGQDGMRHPVRADGQTTEEGTFYSCDCCGTSVLCRTPGHMLVIVLCAECNKGHAIS